MANWNVVQMDCYPEKDGETDVVFTAHWNCTAEEVDGEKTYTGYVYGSVGLTLDPESPFTPYSQLTKDQVIGWVKDAMGAETVAATEAAVAQQIVDQKNPPVVNPPLPWAV
jgi:hypothetical protein